MFYSYKYQGFVYLIKVWSMARLYSISLSQRESQRSLRNRLKRYERPRVDNSCGFLLFSCPHTV